MALPAAPGCRLALPCELVIPGFNDEANRAQVYICDGPIRPSGSQQVAATAGVGCPAGALQDHTHPGAHAFGPEWQVQAPPGAEVSFVDEAAPVEEELASSYDSAGYLIDGDLYVTAVSSGAASAVSGSAGNPGSPAHQAAKQSQEVQANTASSGGSDILVLDEAAAPVKEELASSYNSAGDVMDVNLYATAVSSGAANADISSAVNPGAPPHAAAAAKQSHQVPQNTSSYDSDVFVLEQAAPVEEELASSYNSAGDLIDGDLYVTAASSSTANAVSGSAGNPGAPAHPAAAAKQSQEVPENTASSDILVDDADAAAADSNTNEIDVLEVD
jgi:hypothetical protein